MEILNNFASIYCFITFIIGAVFMLAVVFFTAMGKVKELKVHFYIKRVVEGFDLWLKDKRGFYRYITYIELDDDSIINPESFRHLEYDEMREVNLMED